MYKIPQGLVRLKIANAITEYMYQYYSIGILTINNIGQHI